MAAVRLVLYSRPGCHLCDEMKAVVRAVGTDYDYSLEEVDVSTDAGLEADLGTEIPVLFINDRKAFKYRVTAGELRRRLRNATRGLGWWS